MERGGDGVGTRQKWGGIEVEVDGERWRWSGEEAEVGWVEVEVNGERWRWSGEEASGVG